MREPLRQKDVRHVLLLVSAVVFGLSAYANLSYFFLGNPKALALFPPFIEGYNQNHNAHLGAEYFFIAQALAAGKGFSNPFQVETGPTAWMPPLYCYFLALLLLFSSSKFVVGSVVVFCKNLVLIAVGMMLYVVAKKTTRKIKPLWVIAIYCAFLANYFRWFFQITHDEWVLLLIVSAVFYFAAILSETAVSVRQACLWGCFGGVAMLASPIAGCTWFVLTLYGALRHWALKNFFISAALCVVICLPWVLRNYLVFDSFILVKSNFYFDLYTSNYETENGIHKEAQVLQQHPVWTVPKGHNREYATKGEAAFMAMYKNKFLQALSENPRKYFRNVKNRLYAALIWYPVYGKYEQPHLLKTIVHALPFIGLIAIILCRAFFSSVYIPVAVLIYCVYLTPYILVGYYIRYSIPLTAVLCLFVFWGIDACCARVSGATHSIMLMPQKNRLGKSRFFVL